MKLQITLLLSEIFYTVHAKTAFAAFNNLGVSGRISFTQDSQISPVTVSIDLDNLNTSFSDFDGLAGFHIHQYPVGTLGNSPTSSLEGCSNDVVGGHYNPLNVDLENYLCSLLNHGLCEAGDLSGKFGSLAELSSLAIEIQDNDPNFGLNLFGERSVIGRSIVLHRNDAIASRFVCANIQSEEEETKTWPVFVEQPQINGIAIFHQAGDFVSLFTRLSSNSAEFLSLRIMSTCDTDAVTQWQIDGVRSGNFFRSFDVFEFSIIESTALEINIPEYGSICIPFGRKFHATFTSPISGSINFHQVTENDPVGIDLNLHNLGNNVESYRINSFPTSNCNIESSAILFNPLLVSGAPGGLPGPYQCDDSAPDFCAAGDLSGKFGLLSNFTSIDEHYQDIATGLNLFGPNSIFGRSLVLYSADGTPVACANITDAVLSTKVVEAVLRRSSTAVVDEYTGVRTWVQMSQPSMFPEAETSIFVKTSGVNGTSSVNHNWHVHSTAIAETEEPYDCGDTGGHYNPDMVNGGEGVSGYEYLCSSGDVSLCELGDLVGKHGAIEIDDGKEYMFFDANLPLSGYGSIAERAVVLHVEERGAPRLACGGFNLVDLETDTNPESESESSTLSKVEELTRIGIPVALVLMAFGLMIVALVMKQR